MPEGPTIILLREAVAAFTGRKILRAAGNAKIDMARLAGQRIKRFRSWGKHFLIEVPGVALRVHFLMFGSYLVNERKPREPRLALTFDNGELNLYSCAIRIIDEPLDDVYDWSADVMSDLWDAAAARRKLRAAPTTLVCDALLDQAVFAGVGNIIKNEVLFRIRVHPLSTVGALPATKLRALVEQARQYSFDFLGWKREYVLRQHWLVHNKGACPRCGRKLTRAYLGDTERRSFFCTHCQSLHVPAAQRQAVLDAPLQKSKPARKAAATRAPLKRAASRKPANGVSRKPAAKKKSVARVPRRPAATSASAARG